VDKEVDLCGQFSTAVVVNRTIVGTSPITLPACCVRCGQDSGNGVRVGTTLYAVPRWIWVGLLWGVFPVILLYYAARRPCDVEYWVCDECVARMRKRRCIALVLWAFFLAAVVVSVTSGLSWYVGVAVLLLVVAAMIASRDPSLTAAGRDGRRFAVRGACPEFIAKVTELD